MRIRKVMRLAQGFKNKLSSKSKLDDMADIINVWVGLDTYKVLIKHPYFKK